MIVTAGEILAGVISGVIVHNAVEGTDKIKEVFKDPETSNEDKELLLLGAILAAVAPKEKENKNFIFALQPYPYEKVIDEEFHGKSHLCIFFHDQTPIRFDIEGLGTLNKTVGPGWVQCDVRGRISTTDSTNHNVILSYRDDAVGVSL